jgi:hypothetical protein
MSTLQKDEHLAEPSQEAERPLQDAQDTQDAHTLKVSTLSTDEHLGDDGPPVEAPPPEPDLPIPDFLQRPPGLSWREIDRLSEEVKEWVHGRRDEGDISQSVLEDEIRRRLAGTVLPEAIEIEVERVTRSLFETKEARRAT